MGAILALLPTLLRFWYIPVIVVLAGLWWARGVSLEHAHNKVAAAQQQLSQAQRANAETNASLDAIKKEKDLADKITAEEIAKAQKAQADLSKLKKDIHNAPGSDVPAGAFFDGLSDRLRGADTGN